MNIERLNMNINGEAAKRFEGNPAMFDDLSTRVGAPLPQAYIDFMNVADGGHPQLNCIASLDDDDGSLFDVAWFYTLSQPMLTNVIDALTNWAPVLGARALPIGRDGGGNQYYLDLRDTPASVWIYLHDEDGARVRLADCFEAFIDALYFDPDMD